MTGWMLALALAGESDGAGALEAYQARRLDVVEKQVSTVYAKGYDGSGRFWFVTQGPTQLTAVQFADAIGDVEQARTLRRRRTTSGVVGVGALVLGAAASFFTTYNAESLLVGAPTTGQKAYFASTLGASVVGIVGGTVVLARLPRSRHPSTLYTEEEALGRAQQANAVLRDELLGED